MATTRDSEDLVSVGAYVPGSNPRIDEALQRRTPVEEFLRQPADALCSFGESVQALQAL
jgi:flagellar biosynthesis/type III secretory pathway ATPase